MKVVQCGVIVLVGVNTFFAFNGGDLIAMTGWVCALLQSIVCLVYMLEDNCA